MKEIRVGLDIGGTKIAAIATASQQQAVAKIVRPTNTTSPEAFIDSVSETIAHLAAPGAG